MKVFVEEQRFRKWFLVPIIALPLIGIIILSVQKNNELQTSNSESFWGILISVSIILAVIIFIVSMKLTTKVDEKGIHYQFYPIHFVKKFIDWRDIDKCYIRKYNSLREFHGYGYRIRPFGKNKGVAINVSGNYGLQLELKNGKRLLIGTQKQEQLKITLEVYKEKYNKNEQQ